jgi:hypothetical protein
MVHELRVDSYFAGKLMPSLMSPLKVKHGLTTATLSKKKHGAKCSFNLKE